MGSSGKGKKGIDLTSVIGLSLGLIAVVGGQVLEGGHLSAILQPTAAIIVMGGTIGATVLSFPMGDVKRALSALKRVFTESGPSNETLLKEILGYATKARKNGLISLEQDIKDASDAFLAKAMRNAVDGMDPKLLGEAMEAGIEQYEQERMGESKVYASAGGYAPTIGILGAVLGLIHVMENLSDPSKLGAGIAVAFVATVYGVGSANLIFLPIAKKLEIKTKKEVNRMFMIMEGVLSIQAGINPHYIEEELSIFVSEGESGARGKAGMAAGKAPAGGKVKVNSAAPEST